LDRALELLSDVRMLWAHPGVTPEQRQSLAEEVFEEIQLDDEGIAAVLPRAPYLVLAAVAAGMEMVGEAGFEPTTTCPPDRCATRLRHSPSEFRC
jgi:hypothetical protein